RPPEGEGRSTTERIDRLTGDLTSTGQRRRGSRRRPEPAGGAAGDSGDLPPSLPDLPGSSSSGGSGSNRIIILGALLFLAMAAIAVVPRLMGDNSSEPTPTPEMIQTPTPPGDQAAESPPAPTQSIQDAEYVVCIDAGHGGWDTGRVREANSRAPAIWEKEINLGMAWMLKERLESEGIGVVLTRPSGLAVNAFNEDVNGDGQTLQDSEQAGDRDELQARINICNDAEADLLVSLHLNGYDDPSARGYEVLYTPAPFREFGDRNADLATYIYREITAAYEEAGFETTPRGTIPDVELDAEMHAHGAERHLIMTGPAIENADFTLVPSAMPGVVIEPVFITNDDDAAFIARLENQRHLVNAYADGILTYFENYPDGL
ncbi:MAG TPA: N-acetylmuramoyl-L-alanine amidase, partial [Thermomicrobiales bacterium]|nr:N-acetylmuramoyl-L-alanine amidase [Thermomicrobiales bacterium]